LAGGIEQQRRRQRHQRKARGHAQPRHQTLAAFAGQQLQARDQQRHDDRRDEQVLAHGVPYPPSTWSLPLSPREVSSTTRNSAVVAKPITIAVSTSACGSWSAYCAMSPAVSCSTGSAPVRRPPMEKMNRLTA